MECSFFSVRAAFATLTTVEWHGLCLGLQTTTGQTDPDGHCHKPTLQRSNDVGGSKGFQTSQWHFSVNFSPKHHAGEPPGQNQSTTQSALTGCRSGGPLQCTRLADAAAMLLGLLGRVQRLRHIVCQPGPASCHCVVALRVGQAMRANSHSRSNASSSAAAQLSRGEPSKVIPVWFKGRKHIPDNTAVKK